MPSGKVIFFNTKSRFGFIKSNEDGNSYYVHEKNLIDKISIRQDDVVVFELKESKRGKEAVRVRKVNHGDTEVQRNTEAL